MDMARMPKQKRIYEVACLGLALMLFTQVGDAGPKRRSGCEASSHQLLMSCRNEAFSDFWLAVAKAFNLPTWGGRRTAIWEAGDSLGEAVEECREQYQARLDLCDALGEDIYDPVIDPADFEDPEENQYFPLVPGVTRVYEAETDEGLEQVVVTVTDETREILGVECQVLLDIVTLDGEVIEDTRDYYVGDRFGNVWYFGENSVELEDGLIVSTEGSWIGGEDGAKPGIIMKANPQVGDVYRQEWAAAEAEDAAVVISLSENVIVPFGEFEDCLQTEDFTPIEPGVSEHKFYAPDVGVVLERNLESGEELVLVDVIVE